MSVDNVNVLCSLLLYNESVMISSLTYNFFIHIKFQFTLNIKSVMLRNMYSVAPINRQVFIIDYIIRSL